MTELKPCPFCESKGQLHDMNKIENENETNHFTIMCTQCFAMTAIMEFSKEATDAWNRRATGD